MVYGIWIQYMLCNTYCQWVVLVPETSGLAPPGQGGGAGSHAQEEVEQVWLVGACSLQNDRHV